MIWRSEETGAWSPLAGGEALGGGCAGTVVTMVEAVGKLSDCSDEDLDAIDTVRESVF